MKHVIIMYHVLNVFCIFFYLQVDQDILPPTLLHPYQKHFDAIPVQFSSKVHLLLSPPTTGRRPFTFPKSLCLHFHLHQYLRMPTKVHLLPYTSPLICTKSHLLNLLLLLLPTQKGLLWAEGLQPLSLMGLKKSTGSRHTRTPPLCPSVSR